MLTACNTFNTYFDLKNNHNNPFFIIFEIEDKNPEGRD